MAGQGERWAKLRELERTAVETVINSSRIPSRRRHKVYVLCGGDSAQRHAGLASAVNVYLSLAKSPDLEVTLYVLRPTFSGFDEVERRREMLARRSQMLRVGVEENDITQEFAVANVVNPMLSEPETLRWRNVWAVPHALALRRSVEDIVEACDMLLHTRSTVEHSRLPAQTQSRNLMLQVRFMAQLRVCGAIVQACVHLRVCHAVARDTYARFDRCVRAARLRSGVANVETHCAFDLPRSAQTR